MQAIDRWHLKKQIDLEIAPYGASAVSWETSWCSLRIVKYDSPYEALRSAVYSDFIKDEQDWTARKSQIIAELAKLTGKAQA